MTGRADLPSRPGGPDAGATADPAVASRAIRHLLVGSPRDVEVMAAFPLAVYLAVGDDLVAVVAAGGVQLPNALVLRSTAGRGAVAGVRVGQRGVIGDGRLRVGPLRLRPSRWWDPRPRLRPVDAGLLRAATQTSASRVSAAGGQESALADATAASLSALLGPVQTALAAGDRDAAATAGARLIGLGPGLTPAGDDVLCGLVAGLLLLGPVVRPRGRTPLESEAEVLGRTMAALAPGRTTRISVALLRHAARGEVALPAATFLRALTGHEDVRSATASLLAVGSTSGHDLAVGLLAAANLLTGAPAAAVTGAVTAAPSRDRRD